MPDTASGTVHHLAPAQPTAQDAARELMGRMQAAVRAQAGELGGWPPSDATIRILDGWFAEHGLHIDNEVR